MVNNYNRILSMANRIGYLNKWVLLEFMRRRSDSMGVNKLVSKRFSKLLNINMRDVAEYCDNNKCRCYLSFFDEITEKNWRMTAGTIDRIEKWNKNNEIYNTKGLHLIDVDNVLLEEEQLGWLENKGVNDIFIFPSKTGHSIVFLSESSIILDYCKNTDWNDINSIHVSANINLYIPDFN